jgi:cytochrome c-type biogenesis protein CcmF
MALGLLFGGRGFSSIAAFGLAGFAGGSALRQLVLACRRTGWRGVVGRTNGGMIVHLGVVLLAFGLTASESYRSDRTVLLERGEQVTIEGHEFRYLEAGADVNDRRLRTFALIEIDGDDIYAPAITNFRRSGMVVPTPSVRSGPTEDLFLVLDELPDRGTDAIRLRVVIRPMVAWIWAGGILMAVGSVLALIPTARPRRPRREHLTGDRSPDGIDEGPTSGDDVDSSATPPERELVGD